MPTWYKAPIYYTRFKPFDPPAKDAENWEQWEYTNKVEERLRTSIRNGHIDSKGEPWEGACPGMLVGTTVVPMDRVLRADWYCRATDTCVVALHPGAPAPSSWVKLTRSEFLAQAAEAAAAPAGAGGERPGWLKMAEETWPTPEKPLLSDDATFSEACLAALNYKEG